MLVINPDSTGDWNFHGQRHAADACCTGEAHASGGVSYCRQLDGRVNVSISD